MLAGLKHLKALALLLAISACASPVAAQIPNGDTLRVLALRVSQLELDRQLRSATSATIDSLLSLYADSVVYEHPNAGAIIRGKTELRHGMMQFIGSIRAVRASPPQVTVGNGVALVETRTQMEVENAGKWIAVLRHGVRVLEFDRQFRIRRIIDYPW